MFGCLCCRLRAQRTRTGWWVEKILINLFLFLQTSPEGKNTQRSLSITNKVIIKLKLALHLSLCQGQQPWNQPGWDSSRQTTKVSGPTEEDEEVTTHTHSVISWWDPLKDIWTLEIFSLPKAVKSECTNQSSSWAPISTSWFNWKSSLIGRWHRFCLTSGICPSHCLMFYSCIETNCYHGDCDVLVTLK